MKYLIFFLSLLLYNCSIVNKDCELKAKLRITIYKSKKNDGQTLLLLTTIFENMTNKNIYLIKSPPWYRYFSENDSNGGFAKIPNSELTSRVMHDCVNSNNYLKRIIYAVVEKKEIVDSIAVLNKDIIKRNYNNYTEKFKTQFLVLKRGEKLEIDNAPIYDTDSSIREFKFLVKESNELSRRNKLGENINIPGKMGNYSFWDGEIKLNSENIEIVFKEI
jgi:hypothetical protein